MKIEEILIKYFEWTEQEIKEKAIAIQSVNIKDEKIALNKLNFYQNEFNLRTAEVIKMIKLSPSLLCYSEEGVKTKVEFYQKEFGLDKNQLIKMLKIMPALLSYSEESIKDKIAFYQKEFGISKQDYAMMIKTQPALISYFEETIKAKVIFYQTEFDLTKEEFVKMLKVLPKLLSYSEESIKTKVKLYQKKFDLSKEEFVKMLKILPAMLGYSEESIKAKTKQILDLNISKSIILKEPTMLTVPINNLKVRYIILRQFATREEILLRTGWFMTNQSKSYARLMHLKSKNIKAKISQVLNGEKRFKKAYGVASKDLMKKYKLTPDIIYKMQQVLEVGEISDFTQEENQFIDKEYGL